MAFYDLMGLPATATQDEIKKAYRRLVSPDCACSARTDVGAPQAIKFHPDKNPNDPTAGEVFREIAIAYTTLSDVGLRYVPRRDDWTSLTAADTRTTSLGRARETGRARSVDNQSCCSADID